MTLDPYHRFCKLVTGNAAKVVFEDRSVIFALDTSARELLCPLVRPSRPLVCMLHLYSPINERHKPSGMGGGPCAGEYGSNRLVLIAGRIAVNSVGLFFLSLEQTMRPS